MGLILYSPPVNRVFPRVTDRVQCGRWDFERRDRESRGGSMSRQFLLCAAALAALRGSVQAAGPQQAGSDGAGAPAATHRATLDRYCVSCHNDKTKAGGLALDTMDLARIRDRAESWEKVVRKLRAG